jgi:hypothetical protein
MANENPNPKTAKRDAPISSTSAESMPDEKDVHKKVNRKEEEQKFNDATSIPNSPIRQGETRAEENKSEGEHDTGLNEPVPQGEESANIGKL